MTSEASKAVARADEVEMTDIKRFQTRDTRME